MDIEEHMVTLRSLASGVDHVTEFGVRSGVSTFSWLVGGATTVVGYDLEIAPSLRSIQKLALGCNRTLLLVEADTATVEINETDILFIDSLHSGEHLRKSSFASIYASESTSYFTILPVAVKPSWTANWHGESTAWGI